MKKRTIFITIGAIVLVGAAIVACVFAAKNSKRNKQTVIAFYDIPESCIEVITEIAQKDTTIEYVFKNITEKEFLAKNIEKKYDMVFCYNDANTFELAEKAITIPDNVAGRTPSTIKNSRYYTYNKQFKIMPVAIDMFEAAYLETTSKRYDIPVPESLAELNKFGRTSKFYYAVPFLIAGEVDQNINSLLTMMVQTYGGKEAYFQMVDKLKTTTDFHQIYDYKIGGQAEDNITVSTLLDVIKEWQTSGYLAHNWTTMSLAQTDIMIEDNRTALEFMNLSEHRTKPMPNARYFKMLELACGVQPVIVGMGFNDSEAVRIVMNRISLPASQEQISFKTRFGPSMLQGTSYDIQADDARYYAAATEVGPVPDLGTAALKTKEQRAALAQAIREYF